MTEDHSLKPWNQVIPSVMGRIRSQAESRVLAHVYQKSRASSYGVSSYHNALIHKLEEKYRIDYEETGSEQQVVIPSMFWESILDDLTNRGLLLRSESPPTSNTKYTPSLGCLKRFEHPYLTKWHFIVEYISPQVCGGIVGGLIGFMAALLFRSPNGAGL